MGTKVKDLTVVEIEDVSAFSSPEFLESIEEAGNDIEKMSKTS